VESPINIGTSGAENWWCFGGEKKKLVAGRESGSDAWKYICVTSNETPWYGTSLPLAQE
jgi:aldehyde dehydrogenase (NAD+)